MNNSTPQFQADAGDNGVSKLFKIRSFPWSIKKSEAEKNKKDRNYRNIQGEGCPPPPPPQEFKKEE